ncbi:ATP binding protein [Gonapodya sp. JEL0774]|nr:ATP binding protein [Gonapodya sp. JEL0774]
MTHCESTGRSAHLVNLDPAAENFEYQPTIDIRELVPLEDVMEELGYGPNGGLVYCMEYLVDNMEWLDEELQSFDDDYLILDCPGQIELYTHIPVMKRMVQHMQHLGYTVCGVYIIDSQFIEDTAKYFAGVLSATATMVQLEIPHINVMSKMDLLGERAESAEMERYLEPDPGLLLEDANVTMRPKFYRLNEALVKLIDEFNMVQFVPLNIEDEDSITYLLAQIDNAMQYGEDLEPKEPKDELTGNYDDDQ